MDNLLSGKPASRINFIVTRFLNGQKILSGRNAAMTLDAERIDRPVEDPVSNVLK